MPENNFVQFNSSKNNMMNDSTYTQQAPQGIVGGGTIADSTLHNKLFYQLSTMVSAIAQLMVDNGFDSQDTNLITLKDNLSNTMTNITKTFMTTGERYDNNDNWVIKDLGIHIWNSDSIVDKPNQQNPYSNGYCFMGTTWNNMLIQWGEYSFLQLTEYYIAQDNCKVTLHLPYTRNYQIITCDSGQACYPCGARQIDKTSFYIYCRRKLDGNVQQESDASVYEGILRWYTIGMG